MTNQLIRELLARQQRLSRALLERYPDAKGNRWLIGAQVAGGLELEGEIWSIGMHGAGVTFTRQTPTPHLVIDMHTSVTDLDAVDPWRLQQFAESKGQPLSYDEAKLLLRQTSDE